MLRSPLPSNRSATWTARVSAYALLALAAMGAGAWSEAQAHAAPRTTLPPATHPRAVSLAEPVPPVVLTGTVLDALGAPAPGAVVVSSAGGQAVSGPDGIFRLELVLSPEAERVQVTAVRTDAAGNQLAQRDVALAGEPGAVAVGALTLAPGCDASWVPTFGQSPNLFVKVDALCVFDDGNGPALYAGGGFQNPIVSVGGVARWDGSSWTEIGRGASFGDVQALTTFDDGSGSLLIAGGSFTSLDGVPLNRVAAWDGAAWSPLGAGVNAAVFALATHDDGTGPALYAGGDFLLAGGAPAERIARWDGAGWTVPGGGMNRSVRALGVFDLGAGPKLYAGGSFSVVDGLPANGVAAWDGSSWSALGAGLSSGDVNSLLSFDDGSGLALYAGGSFFLSGSPTSHKIARWDGASWSPLPNGDNLDGAVLALTLFDDGGGPALYAGGRFRVAGTIANYVLRWTGSGWARLANGVSNHVFALAAFDDGSGPALYVGGTFGAAEDVVTGAIGRWDGLQWSALARGLDDQVRALAVFDDGTGPALFAGGAFHSGSAKELTAVGRWTGTEWEPLSLGPPPPFLEVHALAVFDDGSGPALIAGGESPFAVPQARRHLARWTGSGWEALGSGISSRSSDDVTVLATLDLGTGPALYVAGDFVQAGGLPANGIARWDGTSWSALGSGLRLVGAFAAFDDGSGPALYAGGQFSGGVGSQFYRGIARFDGSTWGPVGGFLSASTLVVNVDALALYDDGHGTALYAGGTFQAAGGVPVTNIARWDGTSWSAVGGTVSGPIRAFAVHDDGSGPSLYAGGDLTVAGGLAVNRIARWDGRSWSGLGAGSDSEVLALLGTLEADGPALYMGGSFDSLPDSRDGYLARWRGDLRLSFEGEDDFATRLANGQDIGSPEEFGRLVTISSSGPNAGAAIFDSTPGGPNDPSQDRDLLVGRGNVLILQTNQNTTQSVPGRFDRPNDDSDGGTLCFDFPSAVVPHELVLIDIDNGSGEATLVTQTDGSGRKRVHTVPANWTGDILTGGDGQGTLDLSSLAPQPGWSSTATASEGPGFDPTNVVRLEVTLGSSGAVDDLCFELATPQLRGPHLRRAGGVRPIWR